MPTAIHIHDLRARDLELEPVAVRIAMMLALGWRSLDGVWLPSAPQRVWS
jgi:hypothetical protein